MTISTSITERIRYLIWEHKGDKLKIEWRVVEIQDRKILEAAKGSTSAAAAREKSDPLDPGSVGAPMSGSVVEVLVSPGQKIAAGEPIVVLSAMKMETTVASPVAGTCKHVGVVSGDTCSAGDLMCAIDTAA